MQRRYLSIYFLAPTSSPHTALDSKPLLSFCKRYSPLVSLDEPFGILLDTTGCDALFGGERALLSHVQKEMLALGFVVQVAIAPTPLCARVMARFKPNVVIQPTDLPQVLYPLPIESLELEARSEQTLHELGIKRLLELFRLPRAQVLMRFGAALIDRIDEIRGDKKDPRVFVPDVRDWFIEEHLSETVRDSSYLCEAVLELLKRLCKMLSHEGLGLQKLELRLTHLDRKQSIIAISAVRPSADASKLFRLLSLKLDKLDAGLGIEFLRIQAKQVKKLAHQEVSLAYKDIQIETDLSTLLDTLLNRVGDKNVFQFAPHESHIPEKAFKQVGVVSLKQNPPTPFYKGGENFCPTRIFEKPEPIEVIAMLPDSPPRRIVWRRRFVFHIIKADGPERIETEWWQNSNTETRDYYCVEDGRGLRLWVFKQMLAAHPIPSWYIHGLLG